MRPIDTARFLAVALAVLSSAGCLRADVEHTVVIEPDGSVEWSVFQSQVVSTDADPMVRQQEEEAFRRRLLDRDPPIAEALRILGGWRVEVDVLRDERPFAVSASARFSRLDRMLQSYFDRVHPESGVRVELDQDGVRSTLRIFLPESDKETAEPTKEDEALSQLQVEEDNFHLFLARGRFVEAEGFRIDLEGSRATPALDDAKEGESPERVLTITWEEVSSSRPPAPSPDTSRTSPTSDRLRSARP